MSAYIFTTKLKTSKKRFSQWMFILGGIFLVSTQGYNFLQTMNAIYLVGFLVGFWILAQGVFFNYFMSKITLTIDDTSIRHHRSKTILKSDQNLTLFGNDIKNILLDNYKIRIILNDNTSIKLRLPGKNKYQFFDIENQLQKFAGENGVSFESRDWWKKMRPFKRLRTPKIAAGEKDPI